MPSGSARRRGGRPRRPHDLPARDGKDSLGQAPANDPAALTTRKLGTVSARITGLIAHHE